MDRTKAELESFTVKSRNSHYTLKKRSWESTNIRCEYFRETQGLIFTEIGEKDIWCSEDRYKKEKLSKV